MLKYSILFLAGLIVSLLLTPWVKSIAQRLGALDLPGERKIHNRPIPHLGGISIFIGFNLVLLVSSQLSLLYFPTDFLKEINFRWLFVASALVLGLGMVDDFRRIPPSIKFFFQIIAGLIVALTCYKIEVISLPFGTFHLGIWAVPATVFWVVAITNAINLLDGLDGLAAGTAFIVCLTMFGVSVLTNNIGVALVSMILAGSILGFLKYNFHPASIFLGDAGAYFLGFKLSILSLQSGLKGTTAIAIMIPILALGLPILDTMISMLRRLLQSLHIMDVDKDRNLVRFFFIDGWSIFRADRDHIHHKLLEMGFTQKKVVILLYAISLVLGGLALSSFYFKNFNHALFITTIGIASYIGIRKLGYSEMQVVRNGTLLPIFNVPVISRGILRVFVDLAMISVSYYLAFLLRHEGEFLPSVRDYYLSTLPVVLAVRITSFYFVGLYKGAWRYTSVGDLMRIVKAVVLGCAASGFLLWLIPGLGVVSRAVLLIDFNLLLLFVIGARSSFRILEHFNTSQNHQGRKVLIYGVGKKGIHALNELIANPRLALSPVGFIDDEPRNQGKQVNGYPVLGTLDSLETILDKNSISEVIVSGDDCSNGRLDLLTQTCFSHGIPLRRFQTRLEQLSLGGIPD
jgi:UDP-GlcNAc:undecaprenyl-phosphate/decaprenyl-phosphate GlcNAc-1-phosphate transferase